MQANECLYGDPISTCECFVCSDNKQEGSPTVASAVNGTNLRIVGGFKREQNGPQQRGQAIELAKSLAKGSARGLAAGLGKGPARGLASCVGIPVEIVDFGGVLGPS